MPVAQNRELWAMPLDEFQVIIVPELSNYAEQLLIEDCLTNYGYEWPVPWRDTGFPQPANFNRTGVKVFNTEIAKQYGYHDAPAPDIAESVAWAEFGVHANSYAPDELFRARFMACGEEARDENTLAAVDGLNYVAGLASQAEEEAISDRRVRETARAWESCFSEFVAHELPDDPWSGMPTMPMVDDYGVAGPDMTPTPSADEIRVAEADAACRETSGYSAARYQAVWEAQQLLVAKNRDKLDRIRREANDLVEKLKLSIAANAPSR